MKWYFKVGNVFGVVAIALALTGCESWNAINELVDTEKLWAGRVLVKDTQLYNDHIRLLRTYRSDIDAFLRYNPAPDYIYSEEMGRTYFAWDATTIMTYFSKNGQREIDGYIDPIKNHIAKKKKLNALIKEKVQLEKKIVERKKVEVESLGDKEKHVEIIKSAISSAQSSKKVPRGIEVNDVNSYIAELRRFLACDNVDEKDKIVASLHRSYFSRKDNGWTKSDYVASEDGSRILKAMVQIRYLIRPYTADDLTGLQVSNHPVSVATQIAIEANDVELAGIIVHSYVKDRIEKTYRFDDCKRWLRILDEAIVEAIQLDRGEFVEKCFAKYSSRILINLHDAVFLIVQSGKYDDQIKKKLRREYFSSEYWKSERNRCSKITDPDKREEQESLLTKYEREFSRCENGNTCNFYMALAYNKNLFDHYDGIDFFDVASSIRQGNGLDQYLNGCGKTRNTKAFRNVVSNGNTPSADMFAKFVCEGNIEMVKLCRDAGCKPFRNGFLIYAAATHCDKPEILDSLLEMGFRIDEQVFLKGIVAVESELRSYSANALGIAILKKDKKAFEFLLKRNFPIDSHGEKVVAFGNGIPSLCALEVAIFSGDMTYVDALIKNGANVKLQTCSPLHLAVVRGNELIVKKLLDSGADVNFSKHASNGNPIDLFFPGKGHAKVTKFLCAPLPLVLTLMQDAEMAKKLEQTALLLIERGADLNAGLGETADRTMEDIIEDVKSEKVRAAIKVRQKPICSYDVGKLEADSIRTEETIQNVLDEYSKNRLRAQKNFKPIAFVGKMAVSLVEENPQYRSREQIKREANEVRARSENEGNVELLKMAMRHGSMTETEKAMQQASDPFGAAFMETTLNSDFGQTLLKKAVKETAEKESAQYVQRALKMRQNKYMILGSMLTTGLISDKPKLVVLPSHRISEDDVLAIDSGDEIYVVGAIDSLENLLQMRISCIAFGKIKK